MDLETKNGNCYLTCDAESALSRLKQFYKEQEAFMLKVEGIR